MLKFLIITCLIIKTHSWTWKNYPSPRGQNYSKCGVSKPAWVCDPDGMLTDQQRAEIVELVEDFKEKTKRPNSKFPCLREGLRLVVALAKNRVVEPYPSYPNTDLCTNDRRWTASDRTKCESVVHGIELNTNGFQHCAQIYFFWPLHSIDYENLNREERPLLTNKNYFGALKNYIEKLHLLYIDRFSILDNHDAIKKDYIKLLKEFCGIFANKMLNFLIIIIYLIIKTHSWTWEDYPSPREATYFKCGIQNRTFVCDPDGMLTDQQRKEIVTLVEDFKEKTKRPLSTIPCMREGLRLVVALAKDKIGPEDGSNGLTYLCKNERNWTSSYKTTCDADVQGIELNTDGFRYCYSNTRWLMPLHVDEYEWLGKEDHHLKNKKYYDALKDYIENMQMLYIHRFSIFDNKDPNEDIASQQSYNKVYFIMSVILFFIIVVGYLLLHYRIRLLLKYFNQKETLKTRLHKKETELKLMTPIQTVEDVVKRMEKHQEEDEEKSKPLLNL